MLQSGQAYSDTLITNPWFETEAEAVKFALAASDPFSDRGPYRFVRPLPIWSAQIGSSPV